MTPRSRLLAVSLAALVLLPRVAHAGPPLICFPIDIGGATSLPWGSGPGWNAPRADYDRGHLVTDTLALLAPSTPVLVRMETLRRATIYATSDAGLARDLLARVEERAREGKAGPAGALALFDAGYLLEAYKQARHVGRATGDTSRDGYPMVQQALGRRGADPEMEYAAALITAGWLKDASRQHLDRAVERAPEGSLLARAIESHHDFWGQHIDEMRVRLGRASR